MFHSRHLEWSHAQSRAEQRRARDAYMASQKFNDAATPCRSFLEACKIEHRGCTVLVFKSWPIDLESEVTFCWFTVDKRLRCYAREDVWAEIHAGCPWRTCSLDRNDFSFCLWGGDIRATYQLTFLRCIDVHIVHKLATLQLWTENMGWGLPCRRSFWRVLIMYDTG